MLFQLHICNSYLLCRLSIIEGHLQKDMNINKCGTKSFSTCFLTTKRNETKWQTIFIEWGGGALWEPLISFLDIQQVRQRWALTHYHINGSQNIWVDNCPEKILIVTYENSDSQEGFLEIGTCHQKMWER